MKLKIAAIMGVIPTDEIKAAVESVPMRI